MLKIILAYTVRVMQMFGSSTLVIEIYEEMDWGEF